MLTIWSLVRIFSVGAVSMAEPLRPRGRPRLRSRLVAAARSLLDEEGPAALTARAVAQRAGVTEATVFNNFGARHGLLLALVREGIPEYGDFVAQVEHGPQTSIDAWLIGVFHAAWAFMRATMPLTGHQVLSRRGEPQDAPPSPFFDAHQVLTAQLTRLLGEGRLTPHTDAASAAMLLLGAAIHAAASELTQGSVAVGTSPTELAERIVAQMGLGELE